VLRQRFITAVILAALFLSGVALLPLHWLALCFALVATAGAWEWSALAGWNHRVARIMYALVLPLLLAGLWLLLYVNRDVERTQPWLGASCLFWSVAMLLVRNYPAGTWVWRPAWIRSLMGWWILCGAWLSVIFLLTLPNGGLLLVLLVVAVAAADVGAYFSGRRWGRHKLAPDVSPGKTWEGLWGGLAAVMVVTAVVWASMPKSYLHIRVETLLLMGLAVAGASVLGDLTVSMVKRASGLKDTGSILPGHGGLLDRIDSLAAAGPVFALGLILMDY